MRAKRIFRVDGLASIAAGATGTAITFTWQFSGYVISLLACAQGDGSDAGLASLGLKISLGNGNTEVFANRTSGDFVELMNIHGRSFIPFPIRREVAQQEPWVIQFKNYHASAAYVPSLAMHWTDEIPR